MKYFLFIAVVFILLFFFMGAKHPAYPAVKDSGNTELLLSIENNFIESNKNLDTILTDLEDVK